jgi:hypothetical protein
VLTLVKHDRMMSNDVFQQLLACARAEPEPQRLLFVFTERELPPGASAAQRERYHEGRCGALTPLACVDKSPHEMTTFENLAKESAQACPAWTVVFVAALAGARSCPPERARVDEGLKNMIGAIQAGRVSGLLALDRAGEMVSFG